MTEYRRITSQGRVVIPQGFLDELGLNVGDHVKLSILNGSLVIAKAE